MKITLIAGLLLLGVAYMPAARTGMLASAEPAPKGTLQGTIKVSAIQSLKLKNFACSNIKVSLGTVSGISGAFKAAASAQATGNISSGKCGYVVTNIPTGQSLKIEVTAANASSFNCANLEIRDDISATEKIMFGRGGKDTLKRVRDLTVEPVCN